MSPVRHRGLSSPQVQQKHMALSTGTILSKSALFISSQELEDCAVRDVLRHYILYAKPSTLSAAEVSFCSSALVFDLILDDRMTDRDSGFKTYGTVKLYTQMLARYLGTKLKVRSSQQIPWCA